MTPSPTPWILAHRGASGHAHENTREAFRLARDLGADGVELDVHAARDGGLVVHHDPDLPGAGPIAALDTPTITAHVLPNGETVPLLHEVLDLLGPAEVWVEIKSLAERWDQHLLRVLDAGPTPERYAVHSFDHRIVARLGRVRPTLRRGILLASYPVTIEPLLRDAGASTLWQAQHLIDRDLVTRVHAYDGGGKIVAWTTNDGDDIARLAALGVDGLCGDDPEQMRRVLEGSRQ